MKFLVVLLACVGFIGANIIPSNFEATWARNRKAGRIVGGRETTIEQHPWQVAMIRSGSFYCGGAIISEEWVLSAAHCLDDNPPANIVQYRAGSTNRTHSGQLVGVSYFIVHPSYSSSGYSYDISISRTSTRFAFGSAVNSIALPEAEWDPQVGSVLTVSGWGRAGISSGLLSPTHLREAQIPALSRDTCGAAWPSVTVDETMVCAGEPGKDACNGDSGGPLTFAGRLLVGLVSWGSVICEDSSPGAYARIAHAGILDWIHTTMRQ